MTPRDDQSEHDVQSAEAQAQLLIAQPDLQQCLCRNRTALVVFFHDLLVDIDGALQVAINLLDLDMDPQRALDAPRFRVIEGRKVTFEPSVPGEVIEELRQRGHEIVPPTPPGSYGRGQIIMLDPETGALAGGSDPRADGCALGY